MWLGRLFGVLATGLLDLPEEILVKIMRSLDFKSKFQMYNTCSRLRYIVTLPDVIKVCKLSCSNMASAHYLTFQIFRELGGHLRELNVSCVPNMDVKFLLDLMVTMKVLKVLDVSYTVINIVDLIKIHQICPTINDITINFDIMGKSHQILPELLEDIRIMFGSFNKVHFVGSFESLYYSDLSMSVLLYAKLSKLQLTITGCIMFPCQSSETIDSTGSFDQVIVYILNWKFAHSEHLNGFYLVSCLDKERYEWICIEWIHAQEYYVSSSQIFEEFFREKFRIIPEHFFEIQISVPVQGNLILMIWNKESTVFDEAFYSSLYDQLFDYFPFYQNYVDNASIMPKKWDWLYITRVGVPDMAYYLHLDDITNGKKTLKLTVNCKMDPLIYILLPYDAMYLTKVTFLSLQNVLCYGKDFFPLLFTGCLRLETVNFTFAEYSSAALHYLAQALPMSKTLKNFRLVSPFVDMPSMLAGLSRCKGLENIHVFDLRSLSQSLTLSRDIFENCPNLYCFVVGMHASPRSKAEWKEYLNKFRLRFKRFHLHIEIHCRAGGQYSYDPFVDVFNLCPLKPQKIIPNTIKKSKIMPH